MKIKKFNDLPEVYQIEVTTACNLDCVMCPRKTYGRKLNDYVDVELVKTITERDLGGSYLVELQLIGEPLLHKQLKPIIDTLKPKVQVGLSTNGLLIHKQLPAVSSLDYLTISVDSLTNYENIRRGGNIKQLIDNIDLLMKQQTKPKTDLQIVELPGWEEQMVNLNKLVKEKSWDVVTRTVPDCQLITRREAKREDLVTPDLCLNPYMSVSIHADGDVVPCCFAWGKELVYGNLKSQSLQEIWNSRNVRELREKHRHQSELPNMCQDCYMRSPTLFHFGMIKNHFRRGK